MKKDIEKAKKIMRTMSYDEQCDRFEKFIKENRCKTIEDK